MTQDGERRGGARTVREALEADIRLGRGFRSSADRVRGERARRQELAARAIPYFVPILDDALRAILPNDLILVGAETGVGKTELVQSIAMGAVRNGKVVHYFALEAEPDEIERRTKFKLLSEFAMRSGRDLERLNYADWWLGFCDDITGDLEDEVEYEMERNLSGLKTYYKGADNFGPKRLVELFNQIHEETDLIVVDHLHYVDLDDENENRGFKNLMMIIRDTALGVGRPVILVVHIKKRDQRIKLLVPHISDVHGSSEISKICTRQIMIAPAYGLPYTPGLAPTYFGIEKDRLSGAPRLVALCDFNRRTRCYGDTYTLGRAKHGTDIFVPLDLVDVPRWARHHVPLIGDPAARDEPPIPPPTDDDEPGPPPQADMFGEP